MRQTNSALCSAPLSTWVPYIALVAKKEWTDVSEQVYDLGKKEVHASRHIKVQHTKVASTE